MPLSPCSGTVVANIAHDTPVRILNNEPHCPPHPVPHRPEASSSTHTPLFTNFNLVCGSRRLPGDACQSAAVLIYCTRFSCLALVRTPESWEGPSADVLPSCRLPANKRSGIEIAEQCCWGRQGQLPARIYTQDRRPCRGRGAVNRKRRSACSPGDSKTLVALSELLDFPGVSVYKMKAVHAATVVALAGQALAHGYIYRVTADNTV